VLLVLLLLVVVLLVLLLVVPLDEPNRDRCCYGTKLGLSICT
jgi:hypothetical protein